MENRCQRCNRELSDPNAVFGWRCAEILGVSGELSVMGAETFRKFVKGVVKAKSLFGKSNFEFTDEEWKNLYSAFAKMSLWEGIDDKKVKEAREESYSIINRKKVKLAELSDVLDKYRETIYKEPIRNSPVYKLWNATEDAIWKAGAEILDKAGYHLSSDLLKLAASGSGHTYKAKEGSYASNLLKNDKGLNNFVKSQIWKYGEKKNNPNPSIPTVTYEIPLGNGDIGAALHNVRINIKANKDNDGKWTARVKVMDDFDFTELKNPFKQDSIMKGFLWLANDIAYMDQKWGLLDSVGVEITYTKKY